MKEIIDKAVRGGWQIDEETPELPPWNNRSVKVPTTWIEDNVIYWGDSYGVYERHVDSIIFSHEFLKAYFGEYLVCEICGKDDDRCVCPPNSMVSWQYHAQQLVLSEDRLEYLRRYL